MNKLEMRIISKIIRELSLFHLLHGHADFTLRTKINEEETAFITTSERLKDEALKTVKEKIERERELEVETYGWELIGDIDDKSELEIVGHLIDELKIENTDTQTTLTFIRKNQYKKKTKA